MVVDDKFDIGYRTKPKLMIALALTIKTATGIEQEPFKSFCVIRH